ncbi:MAG: hypothetical protein WCC92_02470 [Candidatus Korobacteraceae bacterium]
MLILKHVRNWSYEIVERDVRANVVYRISLGERLETMAEQVQREGRQGQRVRPFCLFP